MSRPCCINQLIQYIIQSNNSIACWPCYIILKPIKALRWLNGSQTVSDGLSPRDVVTGQVMDPEPLTSHAQETLHYRIALCVSVCETERGEWKKTQLSAVQAGFLCHVSFPRCCNSVIVQGVQCLTVCVCGTKSECVLFESATTGIYTSENQFDSSFFLLLIHVFLSEHIR